MKSAATVVGLLILSCCLSITGRAADPPLDVQTASGVRALMTKGWELGGYGAAHQQIQAIGESSSQHDVALAIALTNLRHNLYATAGEQLTVLSQKSSSPMVYAAIAWTHATKNEHKEALDNFERAARLASTSSASPEEADLVYLAVGSYFGFLEVNGISYNDRAVLLGARQRILLEATEAQFALAAAAAENAQRKVNRTIPRRLLKSHAAADIDKIEQEKTRALRDIEVQIAAKNRDYQRKSQTVTKMTAKWQEIATEHAREQEGPKKDLLKKSADEQAELIREANASIAMLALQSRRLAADQKDLAAAYARLLDEARGKVVAPPADPALADAPEISLAACLFFPFDPARQILLRRLLPADQQAALTPNTRIWTDAEGRFGFIGELLSATPDKIAVRGADDKEILVEINKLSHIDQDYLDRAGAPAPTFDPRDDPSLLARWTFDESSGANESDVVSGYPAKIVGGRRCPGAQGEGARLETAEHYVDLGNPAELNFAGEITLSVWFSNYNPRADVENLVVHSPGNGSPNQVFLRFNRSGKNLAIEAGSLPGKAEEICSYAPSSRKVGQWYHVAATHDGATWRLYVDGQLVDQRNTARGALKCGANWKIGNCWVDADDVRIYNRALSADDIQAIFDRVRYEPTETPGGAGTPVLVKAEYGVGDRKKNVTGMLNEMLSKDPYVMLQPDDRKMGDPAPMVVKSLEITYTVDGKEQTMSIPEGQAEIFPPWPKDGKPVSDATEEFQIVAARYGGGMTWVDITHNARGRILYPTDEIEWIGFCGDDPWVGVVKRCVVWFDYQGKRYVRTFTDQKVGALLQKAEVASLPKKPDYTAKVSFYAWKKGVKPFELSRDENSFCFLSKVAGSFRGAGEALSLSVNKRRWQFTGLANLHIWGDCMEIETDLRNQFEDEPIFQTWKHTDRKRKLIPKSEGFCFLAGTSGAYAGGGEWVRIYIDPADDCWYVDGHGAQAISATVGIMRLKKRSEVELRYAEYHYKNWMSTIRMIPEDEGFGFLTGMGGNWAGNGEDVRVITKDGYWQVVGRSQQWLAAFAYSVRVLPKE